MVLFIYRPEYYHLDTFEDNTPADGMAEIMFEKNRHGSTGNVKVRFQSQFTKFCDVSEGSFGEGGSYDNPSAGITPNQNFGYFESAASNDGGGELGNDPSQQGYESDYAF
jgi:replicative DNA helicase